MIYKTLGRTGISVSRLGFGAMRLPQGPDGRPDPEESVRIIHRAFERGVTYIDTAVGYCHALSQPIVGQALKGWRDRVCVSTKNHYTGPDERAWWKNLEDSLERLDIECIDIYNIHGINWKAWETSIQGPNQVLSWMKKARDQGLIRHICCSFHDDAEALPKIAATDEFSVITLQYNLLDRSLEAVLPELAERNIGVVVMGPVGGGRLGVASETLTGIMDGARSTAEVAMRFVLANPYVTVALSGMSSMEQVEENCTVAERTEPVSTREAEQIESTLNRLKGLADLYCTGCNYCMPCESGVDISRNFLAAIQDRVYGLKEQAQNTYDHMTGRAIYCVACGKCEPKCPQHIPVRVQIREVAQRFDAAYGAMALDLTVVGREDDEIQVRARLHNLSDRVGSASVRLGESAGISVEPSQFEITVDEPFWRASQALRVSGATPLPEALELTAEVEDAQGRRTTTNRFALGECYAAESLEDLRAQAETLKPLVPNQPLNGAARVEGYTVTAWPGYTPDAFLLYARVTAPQSGAGARWRLDTLIDLRDREDELAPGYQGEMYLMRMGPSDSGKVARVVRGALDAQAVRTSVVEGSSFTEIRVEIPWEKLVAPESLELRDFDEGVCIGFELALSVTDARGDTVHRVAWSGNPRYDSDGAAGCLFLTG